MNQKAFTLIELLVVIAIIGVISSIVLVNLSGARGKATTAGGLQFSNSLNNSLGAYAVGVWNFENNANDVSGYNNNCQQQGTVPTYVDSVVPGFRKAVYLPPPSPIFTYFDCGKNSMLFPSEITMEAWAKAEYLDNNSRGIVTNKYSSALGIAIFMHQSFIGANIGGGLLVDSKPPKIEVWYHIVITHDAQNNNNLYVDGKLVGSLNRDFSYNAIDNHAGIGAFTVYEVSGNPAASNGFRGTIDQVRIYDVSLSVAEIQKHYAEGLEKIKLTKK